ncbi:MAG: hypothetical protein [Circular genetic element sp.]|nr:MAG: hypothetical protein [Circular genetic element sp.]
MAKRNYSKKRMSKIEPSVLTITLATPTVTAPAVGQFTVDLSQIACLLNRRFYRQGLNWGVAGIKVLTAGDGVLQVKKLPNTWVMSNAWEKGFRAWQRMNNEALEENESVRPRFLDFKIYADKTHHDAGFGANLLPLDGQLPIPAPYAVGEWEASKIVIPDTAASPGVNNFEIVGVGPNFTGGAGASGLTQVSLIEGYANSRALPPILDPNVPDDMADTNGATPENWISATFNEGTTQMDNVLSDMDSENNIAPYPFENDGTNVDTMYPGGGLQAPSLQVHDLAFVSPTSIGGMTRLKGGNFPCGLMRFDWAPSAESSNLSIVIDLVPGNHRGYLCEPMTEM